MHPGLRRARRQLRDALPETGDTVLELGELPAGHINYSCAMGMYRGVIEDS
jgi:hypothetical protein